MSVEAAELSSDVWTRWQGHLVNGVYPLGRPLGHSAHSGVFLSKSATPDHGPVAVKLIPAGPGLAEHQLPRWARARTLAHSHLLPLLECGACQFEGIPFLYVVMAYADQTLAQLLLQRTLTAEEAREMLPPILDALAYLHAQGLVQGAPTPANILVVGDQLTLASDRVRPAGDRPMSSVYPSIYDPPEGSESGSASDIWGLGVSLLEAMGRRSTAAIGHRNPLAIPADFPPEFRDVVTRCVSQKAQDRPSVQDLQGWLAGRPLKPIAKIEPPAAWRRPEAAAPTTATAPNAKAVPDSGHSVRASAPPKTPFGWRPLALVAGVALALSGISVSLFRSHRAPESLPAPAAEGFTPPTTSNASPAAAPAAAALPAPSATKSTPGDSAPLVAIHEQIPDVARSAAKTIHGHVRISVRAELNTRGMVSRVSVDQGVRSRYFQQLALRAAKQWTFSPPQAGASRLVQIQFDFAREATTARAMSLSKAEGAAAAN